MPRSSRAARTVARLITAATVATLASGCTIGAQPVTPNAVPDSTSPALPELTEATPTQTLTPASTPLVGECRYIPDGGFARYTDRSRVTRCDDEHTAETFWVGEVTGPEADESVPDYAAVIEDTTCIPELTAYLGTADWLATRLYATAFVAPAEDWRLGARWVRCDVYLPVHGENFYRHGEALSAPITLDETMITALHVCLTFDPDMPELAVTVDCAEPHGYERVAPTLDLGFLGEDYPGEDAIGAAADEHCSPVVEGFLGGERAELLVSWNTPTEDTWLQGDFLLICGVEVDGGRVAGTLQAVGKTAEIIPFAAGEDDPAIDPYAGEDPPA